jgi:ribosomal-protein-alanine N-acetyltransferase
VINPEDSRIEIVTMKEEDVDAVFEIETLSFPHPWKRKQFEEELKNDRSCILLATIDRYRGKKVVGYICGWTVTDEIHILNLATHPDFRREGVATALLNALLLYAEEKEITVATLEVRRFNTPAFQLYKKFGFTVKGIRTGYYPEGEDAVVMERKMGGELLEG